MATRLHLERRRSERKPAKVAEYIVIDLGNALLHGYGIDGSEFGIGMHSVYLMPLRVGLRAQIYMPLTDLWSLAAPVVVRHTDGYHHGFEFAEGPNSCYQLPTKDIHGLRWGPQLV